MSCRMRYSPAVGSQCTAPTPSPPWLGSETEWAGLHVGQWWTESSYSRYQGYTEQNLQSGAATVKTYMSTSLPTQLHEVIWRLNELRVWTQQKLRDLQEKKKTNYHWATCRLLGNKVLTNVWHDLFKIISLHYLKVILLKGSLAIELNTINMAFRFSLRATWRPRRVTSSSSRVHNGWLWLLLCNLLSKIWFPVLP